MGQKFAVAYIGGILAGLMLSWFLSAIAVMVFGMADAIGEGIRED